MNGVLWGNPLAWLGIAAIAVPILVHLLATFRARRVPFPTLRFLPESMQTNVRARQVEDWPLLVLRCLIIVVAVAALAQPWLDLEQRDTTPGGSAPIAVVLDNSDSMSRPTPDGTLAIDAARAAAAAPIDGVSPATVIESADLGAGIAAAQAWLAAAGSDEGMAAEIVVISDFQRGSIAAADFGAVPESTGIRLSKIEVVTESEVEMPVLRTGDRAWHATATFAAEETSVIWRALPAVTEAQTVGLEWSAGEGEAVGAGAAAAAATRVVPVPEDARALPVTVVWPAAPQRAVLLGESGSPDEPWMAEVLAAMPAQAAIVGASRDGRLLLFADVEPGTVASAELMAALRGAAGTKVTALAELEPEAIDDSVLRGWQRSSEAAPAPAGNDGRWLWLLVLALLLVEQWARRGRPASGEARPTEEQSDVH